MEISKKTFKEVLTSMKNILKEENLKNENENLISEWGGSARCMTSDGRNVNVADELNRLEKKENGMD